MMAFRTGSQDMKLLSQVTTVVLILFRSAVRGGFSRESAQQGPRLKSREAPAPQKRREMGIASRLFAPWLSRQHGQPAS